MHDSESEFAGRTIADPGFADDDGRVTEVLDEALGAYAGDRCRHPEVLYALAASRVLVPIVALPVAAETSASGPKREKSSDMALITVIGRDGRRALPVFTSVAGLIAWRPDARPVPVLTQRAALSALAEDAAVLLLDVFGPVPFVIEGEALRALAEGTVRRPLYDDPLAAAALSEAARDQPGITDTRLEPASDADARVVLTLREMTAAVTTAHVVAERLRSSDVFRARVLRGLDLAVEEALPPRHESG